jgi:transcriptional regulator with XRE-family HTH domain
VSILENNIRKWRKKRNITLEKMGKILGICGDTVRYMELFAKKKPPQYRLEKMAEVLRVSVDDLWKE